MFVRYLVSPNDQAPESRIRLGGGLLTTVLTPQAHELKSNISPDGPRFVTRCDAMRFL